MKNLSIVVPCYNEQEVLPIFYDAITAVADKITTYETEFLFIDDGSKDGTLQILRHLHERDQRVRYLSFSRNFGKEAGLYAGLQHAAGDYIAVMDADLQDPPELLPEMLRRLESGEYDCVATLREDRKGEPPIRSFFAHKFYQLMNSLSNTNIRDGARDYRLMTRKMVDAVLSMTEYNRFSKGIFGWVGFSTDWIPYENTERAAGTTKWSFWKLFIYALEGVTAFSTAPLVLSSIMGILFCVGALLLAVFYAIKALFWGDPVSGFPTLICAIFFIGGVQLFGIGILGQYLSKVYLEVKRRPVYIVKENDDLCDSAQRNSTTK